MTDIEEPFEIDNEYGDWLRDLEKGKTQSIMTLKKRGDKLVPGMVKEGSEQWQNHK